MMTALAFDESDLGYSEHYSRLFTADLEHVKAGWRMCYKVATINYVLVKSKSSLCAVQTLLLLYLSKDTFPFYQIRI